MRHEAYRNIADPSGHGDTRNRHDGTCVRQYLGQYKLIRTLTCNGEDQAHAVYHSSRHGGDENRLSLIEDCGRGMSLNKAARWGAAAAGFCVRAGL